MQCWRPKKHQAGLDDKEDESNGKIFERPGSKRCPVRLIEKYLSHLVAGINKLKSSFCCVYYICYILYIVCRWLAVEIYLAAKYPSLATIVVN